MHFGIDIPENPKTIQEKLIWLQFYDKANYLKPICADKLKVRDYAKEKLGFDVCVPLLKVYDSPDDIRFEELPDEFVLKTNHAYNQVIVCADKTKLDENEVRNKVKGWLSRPFGINTRETHYLYIERKCYAEKLMRIPGQNDLVDYKFLCFNGEPRLMQLIQDRHGPEKRLQHYDMNLNFVNVGRKDFISRPELKSKDVLPKNFELMKEYAKKLAEPFKFVRVDFYEIGNEVYLGEMTFTPGAFRYQFRNQDDAIKMGNMLDLRG